MPIVDIETVALTGEEDSPPSSQSVADALGRLFGGEPGTTWVRMRCLPASRYAENEALEAPAATFVTVLLHTPPTGAALAALARDVAATVARDLGRSRQHVHVLFEPAAAGRIAFGGTLRE